MKVVPLNEAVVVNPKIDRSQLTDDTAVSFVPMAAVGAADGSIDVSTVRPYAEVKKGYTHFRENDVLFAKVTPCMENGKMAVARNLKNGLLVLRYPDVPNRPDQAYRAAGTGQ